MAGWAFNVFSTIVVVTVERASWWVVAIAKYLFMILLAGLVGAMAGGIVDGVIGLRGATGRHWGWIAGAVIAAVGYPLGYVRYGGQKRALPFRFAEWQATKRPFRRGGRRQQLGVWKSTWSGAVAGLIIGLLAGGALVMIWFSIALSPFAPEAWLQSSGSRASLGPDSEMGVRTRHPMPVALFFGSAATLAIAGGIGGLISGAVSKRRREKG